MQNEKAVFTTGEIAKFCYVAQNTVWRWCEKGKIPFFQTAGGRRRVRRRDLLLLLERLGISTPPELSDKRERARDAQPGRRGCGEDICGG